MIHRQNPIIDTMVTESTIRSGRICEIGYWTWAPGRREPEAPEKRVPRERKGNGEYERELVTGGYRGESRG